MPIKVTVTFGIILYCVNENNPLAHVVISSLQPPSLFSLFYEVHNLAFRSLAPPHMMSAATDMVSAGIRHVLVGEVERRFPVSYLAEP